MVHDDWKDGPEEEADEGDTDCARYEVGNEPDYELEAIVPQVRHADFSTVVVRTEGNIIPEN